MNFPWYEVIGKDDNITQGDIIQNCIIFEPKKEAYKAVTKGITQSAPFLTKTMDVIVLSQACDIEYDKAELIIVSQIGPLAELIESTNEKSLERNGRTLNNREKAAIKERLRQGTETAHHLLNEFYGKGISFPYHVVDFRRIYSLPRDYLKAAALDIQTRLRLLPPYREHLSQAFARYFMRVGLPIDIDKEKLKQFQPDTAH